MKYEQHFREKIASLEEIVADDEKNSAFWEMKYEKLKKSYNREKDLLEHYSKSVSRTGIIVFFCALAGSLLYCITGLASESPGVFFILPFLAFLAYNCIVWEDRSYRNEHRKNVSAQKYEFEESEKNTILVKKNLEMHGQELFSLKNKYLIWKKEREGLLSDISYMRPFEYFHFPLDPVIDEDYYPLGTIDNPQKYRVFVTNGYRYHKCKGCSGALKEVSVFRAIENKQTPCQLCYYGEDDLNLPDWLYTVHEKYRNFWHKLHLYDVNAFINSKQQFEIDIPKNQWELGLLNLIGKAWQDIYDLKSSLKLPILKDTFDVHLAAMLNGISRIIMYEQLEFCLLEDEYQNKIKNLIDSYFLKFVEMPNKYLYFSCSDFYQNSFPIWFKDKLPHAYWYDDYFCCEYEKNVESPLMRTILSVLASFGDIILSEHLSQDYDLLNSYFVFNVEKEKHSEMHISMFRNHFMIPTTRIVDDYFGACWDCMQSCGNVKEST